MNILKLYHDSFKGLRTAVWWLAFVTLINRAGTMVIPFLSLYLTASLDFSLKEVGWVMSSFGLGSVIGAWLGGKLTDKFGFYPIMFWSLFISGFMFIALQYIESFWGFCTGIFFIMLVADAFRPASFVAIKSYSKPENRTRSVTLLRLAINLGFSLGPAMGGLIIVKLSYGGLFWIDGVTCILAALLFFWALDKKRSVIEEQPVIDQKEMLSPYKDKAYWLFLLIILLIGFSFLQYFSTIPLYYRDIHLLSEKHIGWLMAFNGLLIFILEMPLVKYFEKSKISVYHLLAMSTLVFALSFLVLNLTNWVGILIIGMTLMSFAEMLNFPFLNSFAMNRGERGNHGTYMALFTMAFSVSHILGHNSGMQLIDYFGFEFTWYIMTGCLVFAAILILWLKKMIENEV